MSKIGLNLRELVWACVRLFCVLESYLGKGVLLNNYATFSLGGFSCITWPTTFFTRSDYFVVCFVSGKSRILQRLQLIYADFSLVRVWFFTWVEWRCQWFSAAVFSEMQSKMMVK